MENDVNVIIIKHLKKFLEKFKTKKFEVTYNPYYDNFLSQNDQYTKALFRSLDSMMGYVMQDIAVDFAKINYEQVFTEIREEKTYKTYKLDLGIIENKVATLIELKFGGHLDVKKAEMEFLKLEERKNVAANIEDINSVRSYLGIFYLPNKGLSGVYKFFTKEEVLIGDSLWNFLLKTENGAKIFWKGWNSQTDIWQVLKDVFKKIPGGGSGEYNGN